MWFELDQVSAFAQVVLADIVLAGDNAVAVGLAASGLAPQRQRQAIIAGIGLALVLRIIFSLLTVKLLALKGLLLLGGLLLFWVAWRMYRDFSHQAQDSAGRTEQAEHKPVSFLRALVAIVIADVSLSLDNVLVVAGLARNEPVIMVFGLVLSVLLMGVAASLIAKAIQRYRWIAILGILAIVFAGFRMVWEDLHGFLPTLVPAMPTWLSSSGAH